VEILISADGTCFDSSSPGMEEEIKSESDELPRNTASTAESGVCVDPEETQNHLCHVDIYSLKMREIEEEEPEDALECPVDFEKELGKEMKWKELTEKEKIVVKDFLAGFHFEGKTSGFLRAGFDLALSMDFCSYGMKQDAGRDVWGSGLSEEFG